VAKALIDDGHQVTALSRRTGTDLEKLGVKVVQGSLQDLDNIAAAAVEADAVLHLAFDNDLSKYAASNLQDLAVIKTLNKALAGSGKLFVSTSGTALVGDTGENLADESAPAQGPRAAPEAAGLEVWPASVQDCTTQLSPYHTCIL